MRRCEGRAGLAQSIEHQALNLVVVGSNWRLALLGLGTQHVLGTQHNVGFKHLEDVNREEMTYVVLGPTNQQSKTLGT